MIRASAIFQKYVEEIYLTWLFIKIYSTEKFILYQYKKINQL